MDIILIVIVLLLIGLTCGQPQSYMDPYDDSKAHFDESKSHYDDRKPHQGNSKPIDDICNQHEFYMSPALPFIVLETVLDPQNEGGKRHSTQKTHIVDYTSSTTLHLRENSAEKLPQAIWCEGIMFTEVWGIAPPNCLLYNTDPSSGVAKFYLNFITEESQTNLTYLAVMKVFVPADYVQIDRWYCNYIGLFQLQNFRFNFNNIVMLPQTHEPYDLSEVVHTCRVIGARFSSSKNDYSMKIKTGVFQLVDAIDYCTMHSGDCSAIQCKNYNHNVTYMRIENIASMNFDKRCQMDSRYFWGATLMCQKNNDHKWIYYGMATWELLPSCADVYERIKSSYQGFVRIDAYLDWIVSTVMENGGFDGDSKLE